MESWQNVTIRDSAGNTVAYGDNRKRRELLRSYREEGSLYGYYLGDEDESAEGYDGSTAGPSPDEIDWAGIDQDL